MKHILLNIIKITFLHFFTITSKEKLKEYKFDLGNANLKGKWIGIFKELPNSNIELDFTEEIEVKS